MWEIKKIDSVAEQKLYCERLSLLYEAGFYYGVSSEDGPVAICRFSRKGREAHIDALRGDGTSDEREVLLLLTGVVLNFLDLCEVREVSFAGIDPAILTAIGCQGEKFRFADRKNR